MTEEQKSADETKNENALISIEELMRVELVVGKILSCEKVPKSRKLLKMEVSLGGEVRQILAGLAPFYVPEEMLGRRVAVVANLKPAKLMGLESQGMLLAAGGDVEGSCPALVQVPEGIPLGARIR